MSSLRLFVPNLIRAESTPSFVTLQHVGLSADSPLCCNMLATLLQTPGTTVHWYGKEVQNKRKLGHITIVASDNEAAHERLHAVDPAAAHAMDAACSRYREAITEFHDPESSSGQQETHLMLSI